MPAAKPKHIKAKSDKQFKTSEDEYYHSDVMSENMYTLLEHLKKAGALNGIYTRYSNKEDLGVGSYNPQDKDIAVMAENPDRGNSTIAHEITHALNWSDLQSKEQKLKETLEADPSMEKDLVFPSRWEQGRVAAPLTDRFIGYSFADSPEFDKNKKLSGMLRSTADKRVTAVRASVPDRYESWSGLKMLGEGEVSTHQHEEGQAYYLTSPRVATPMGERAKDFGMFLRSYGVPMDIVAPVVEDLSRVAKPKRLWSGGGYELREMKEEMKKTRRTVND